MISYPQLNSLSFRLLYSLFLKCIYISSVCVCVCACACVRVRVCMRVCAYVPCGGQRTTFSSHFSLPWVARVQLWFPGLAASAFPSGAISLAQCYSPPNVFILSTQCGSLVINIVLC